MTSRTPIEFRDTTDPGDDTLRRYRYQHAYGVAILAKSVACELDYRAIWCEQHEDFLGEVSYECFDAIQVKTRNEGDGYWRVGDKSFKKAIQRFAKLQGEYGEAIRRFNFVSNIRVEHRPSYAEHSPELLIKDLQSVGGPDDLKGNARKAFDKLAEGCPVDKDTLYETLSKLSFQEGPPRSGYESVVAHSVLSKLNETVHLNAPALDCLRDEMIARVADASSLSGTDGSEFWSALGGNLVGDPQLRRKRVSIDAFKQMVKESIGEPFRYLPTRYNPSLDTVELKVLEDKLVDGDLFHQFPHMKSRGVAAAARFHEMALKDPEGFEEKKSQIVEVIHAECSEAYLNAKKDDGFFGPEMMKDLLERFRRIAAEEPEKVYGEPVEMLVGTSSILSGECAVGWSKRFPVTTIVSL